MQVCERTNSQSQPQILIMKIGSKWNRHRSSSYVLTVREEPKSKRVPVRLRNKIEKASAAKQRKAKKLAKKVRQMCDSRDPVLIYIEPRMAIENEKGPWHS